MFSDGGATTVREPLRLHRWPASVAAETAVRYRVEPAGDAAMALRGIDDAVDVLAGVDADGEDDRGLLAAVQECQRQLDRLTAQQLRLVGAADRRGSFGIDGAVTMASWLRAASRLAAGESVRRVRAAQRLPRLALLGEALACGNVTAAHALAITDAAVPSRADAVAANEQTLVDLALAASPREVGVALRRIADCADADGSDPAPAGERGGDGRDPRRELDVRARFDGLGEVHGWLDQVDTELLLVLLDAYDTPDAPDAPFAQQRTPGQRRADAFGLLLRAVADAGAAPTVNGARPHLLLGVDLAELLGIDPATPAAADLAERLSRLLAAADPAALDALLAALLAARTPPSDDDDRDRGTADEADADAGDPVADEADTESGGRDATDEPDGDPVGGGPAHAPTATARPDHGRPDHGPPDHGRPDRGRPEDARPEDARPENGRPGDGRPEGGRGPDAGAQSGLADLGDLLDPDPAAAAKGPRLRRTGPVDLATAVRIALDARVTCVLTMGPWRVVNVGRTMRTLPNWLRPILELRHQHCRGPDCDRPAAWTEAHHVHAWAAEHGETDLNRTVPLCKAHHDLVTSGAWTLAYDPGTGACTWTSRRHGTTRTTRPPPR